MTNNYSQYVAVCHDMNLNFHGKGWNDRSLKNMMNIKLSLIYNIHIVFD